MARSMKRGQKHTLQSKKKSRRGTDVLALREATAASRRKEHFPHHHPPVWHFVSGEFLRVWPRGGTFHESYNQLFSVVRSGCSARTSGGRHGGSELWARGSGLGCVIYLDKYAVNSK